MLKSSELGASFITSWFPISSSLGGSSVTISESSLVVPKYTLSSGEAASSTYGTKFYRQQPQSLWVLNFLRCSEYMTPSFVPFPSLPFPELFDAGDGAWASGMLCFGSTPDTPPALKEMTSPHSKVCNHRLTLFSLETSKPSIMLRIRWDSCLLPLCFKSWRDYSSLHDNRTPRIHLLH